MFYVSIHHISAQGCRNDLKNKKSNVSSLVSPPLLDVWSESDHCNALTQSNRTVSYAFSCHTTDTCSEDVDVDLSTALPSLYKTDPRPSWVHVFSKSTSASSQRTQCASGAYSIDKSPKVLHRRSRRAKKKHRKMQDLLREVIVPTSQFRLSPEEIDSDVVVFDGGDQTSSPIKPPDGLVWRSIPVSLLHLEDETRPDIGLTYPMIDGVNPFIRLPRSMSLSIINDCGIDKITKSLIACLKLRSTALSRGDAKRVFTDYGTRVTYACVGPQASRNSKTVLTHPPYMDALPEAHWRSLVWMTKRAERSFRMLASHSVLSHVHHAKRLVPFKTFASPNTSPNDDAHCNFNAQFFGGIAFGSNVFLRCHTDADFTFSIIQVLLVGASQYQVGDEVVVYFCFPTIGVAVPLRPGDYLLFNARIPHCISSRCKFGDEILCTSTYLKTAIVGMNNNDLPLTDEQAWTLEQLN